MNKFRVNLHPAFFYGEAGKKQESHEKVEKQDVETQLENLKKPILDEFKTSTDNFLRSVNENQETKILSRYTNQDRESLKADSKRFNTRIDPMKNGKNYSEVWNQNIVQGFGGLITALKNNNYFAGKNLQEETAKIKELYWNEVKNQYIENVWFASDSKFDSVKDSLFAITTQNSPADKVYQKLTGATTISRVDRTYLEGYEAEILDWNDDTDDGDRENMSDRQNRNFLGDDLPEYLWNIRKTPGIVKALGWLPLFSVEEDRPSKVDRKAIKYFLKTSSKINVEGDKDKAVALMEALHDNRLNTNSGEDIYKKVLEDHEITVDKKYLDNIVKAGSFYINTQQIDNSAREQHSIYLSILKIIESEGGVNNAVNKYKSLVEQDKKDKKEEKKKGYESGEKLTQDLKTFAEKLGITDFTSVNRLLNKGDKYFNKPVEEILANLDNDRVIGSGDVVSGGYKTGAQFLTMFEQVSAEIGRDKALQNLLNRAKLENKNLNLGLNEDNFIEKKIKEKDYKLILLLQNIISKPGEDLYTLLSGKSPLEGIDLKEKEEDGKNKEAAFNEAGEILNKKEFLKNYKELFKGKSVEIQNFADLQASLASCLYDNYKLGLGVGSTLSFNEWAKGLQIGAGAQVRDDGSVLGLNISYNHDFYVGKGWTLAPGASAGIFLPIVSGGGDVFASVGLHLTADRTKINRDTGTVRHYGFDSGFNVLTDTAYLGRHDKWNRAEGIEEAAKFQSEKFEKLIMWKLLDNIRNATDGKLVLTNPKVRESIEKLVNEQKDIKEEDRKTVVDGMLRRLEPYNNADLKQEGVKYAIAEGVAQKYEIEWSNKRKEEVSQKIYRSGYSVGLFWKVGTPEGGVYAQGYFTDNDVDGGSDEGGRTYEIDQKYEGELKKNILDKINTTLGLSENDKIKLKDGFVVIPASIAHRVNVNENMKGLMKKDNNGNILLDKNTPIATDAQTLAVRRGGELIIGGRGKKEPMKLSGLGKEWFTNENIDTTKVLELGEGIRVYNLEVLNQAIDNLNNKLPGNPIQRLSPDAFTAQLISKLNEINAKNKKAKLTIINNNGRVEFKSPVEGDAGRGLEIEYQSRYEIIDSDAKTIADAVYLQALKLNNPAVLNAVKHKPWKEYDAFNKAMENKDYEGAKSAIVPIFKRLDNEIKDNNIKFSDILNTAEFTRLEGDALAQAMMAINNIFARSKQVRGGNGEYEFRRPNGKSKEMRAIIKERYKILNTLKSKVQDPNALEWYESLFNATSKYVDKPGFAQKSAKAGSLGNTIGFNLGDKTNPENPLFNPEIYDPMVNLDELEGFSEEAKDGLHKRAMSLFAKNPALINPVLQAAGINTLGLKPEELVKPEKFRINGNKCELTLDINDKKYTLSAGMKFGFFTQCVNHTIILDDISIAGEDGTSLQFDSTTRVNHRLKESDGGLKTASTVLEFGIAVAGGGNKEPKKPDINEGSENYNDGLYGPGKPGSTATQKTPYEDPADTDF